MLRLLQNRRFRVIGGGAAAPPAVIPWYLSGEISVANCILAYQAEAAAHISASYTNLANPWTYDADTATYVMPTFNTSTGWTFNGSTQYLATGYTPTAVQAAKTIIVKFSGVTGDGGGLFGASNAGNFAIQPHRSDGTVGYWSANQYLLGGAGGALTSGTVAIAGRNCYHNGVAESSLIPSSADAALAAMFIGTWSGYFANCNIHALAYYDTVLTAEQVLAVHTALQSLSAPIRTRLREYPVAIEQCGYEACGDILYAIGGQSGATPATAKVYAYDPAADTWTAKTDLPISVQSPVWRTVNGKIYLIGGLNESYVQSNKTYEYDPAGNTWTLKANMPTAREDMGSAVYNGKIYVFGGLSGSSAIATMEVYNPSNNTWDETKADLPEPKCFGDVGATCNGKIYAIGGSDTFASYPNLTPTAHVWEYDPGGDSWTAKTDLPAVRCYSDVASVGGKLYVVGGATSSTTTYTNTVYEFDPTGNSWTQKNNLRVAKRSIALAEYNGKIYALGGANASGSLDTHFLVDI